MEKPERDAEQSTPQYSAPILPENAGKAYVTIPEPQPFTATLRERLLALLIYIPAYLYCCSWNTGYAFLIFCAFFIAMTEWRHWEEKRSLESWVWLGCLVVTVLSAPLGRNRVWGDLRLLFAHGFAIYWVLCRSGRLSGGESGHLLPLDALNGAVIFPAKHFFLRIRTVFYTLTHLRGADQKRQPVVVFAVVLALATALSLLVLAVQELSGADAVFQDGAKRFLALLTPQIDELVLWRFLLSLPIGAYLFGLVAGTGRESIEALRGRGEAVESCLRSFRKVPFGVWIAVMAVFSAVYLAFFGLQASYLFGAFTRTLPEGYTVAEYARQGFFSLCRVMAVNFALLWLVTRSCAQPVREKRSVLLLCTGILAESLLFAVIAASKLYLYISSFGFTPLRLQSAWLIVVLFAGCACALYALWGGKKAMKGWMLFAGVTLALLHLY